MFYVNESLKEEEHVKHMEFSWLDKYAPNKISEIVGAKKQVSAIISWLTNYDKNKLNNKKNGNKRKVRKKKENLVSDDIDTNKEETENDVCKFDDTKLKEKKLDPNRCSSMVIYGEHGCGKTCIVRAILNDMHYSIRDVNFSKLGHIQDVLSFVENLLTGDSVFDIMYKTKQTRYAVVLDEIESITTTAEKNIILEILRMNNDLWACPVIFIGNRKHKKIINEIKKDTYNVAFYEPEINDMIRVFVHICENEKMMLYDEDVANKIIAYSQTDYRRMILILQELKLLYNASIIDSNIIEQYRLHSDTKDIDHTIYEETNKIFSEYTGISDALRIFGKDKINMPLMVQQNHFMALLKYNKNQATIFDTAADIAKNIAEGDIVENYVYSDQNWNLQDIHGFYTCVYPSYKLNMTINTSKLKTDAKYPVYRPVFRPEYPKDLNKTSTKQINYKTVKIASRFFKNMSINDYIFATNLIKNLLDDNRITDCKCLLSNYDVTPDIITYMLKIDKINGTKKDAPKNMTKKIKELFLK